MGEDERREDAVRRVTAAVDGTRFGPVAWVASTGSTNDDLLAAARDGASPGLVRVTDHQTAGRGRADRTWDDVPGDSLLVSMLLGFDDAATAASIATTVVAVGAVEAVRELGFDEVTIKWPNDLVVGPPGGQRKLAGILAQSEAIGDRVAVVVGMGCNVVGDRLVTPGAVALSMLGPAPDRADLLGGVLRRIDHWLGRVEAGGADDLRARWCDLSSTLGSRVRVGLADDVFEGIATSVAASGALVVETDDRGTVEVLVGDVVSLRPV